MSVSCGVNDVSHIFITLSCGVYWVRCQYQHPV